MLMIISSAEGELSAFINGFEEESQSSRVPDLWAACSKSKSEFSNEGSQALPPQRSPGRSLMPGVSGIPR